MTSRCTNDKDPSWSYYGGRGIKVCKRWRGDGGFERFLADMGERPEGMTLDRKDNDGNYEPDNCRWATRATQTQNSRRAVLTSALAIEIREAHASGEAMRAIHRRLMSRGMKVGWSTVRKAALGITWTT